MNKEFVANKTIISDHSSCKARLSGAWIYGAAASKRSLFELELRRVDRAISQGNCE
jgi:hypothetical protein